MIIIFVIEEALRPREVGRSLCCCCLAVASHFSQHVSLLLSPRLSQKPQG